MKSLSKLTLLSLLALGCGGNAALQKDVNQLKLKVEALEAAQAPSSGHELGQGQTIALDNNEQTVYSEIAQLKAQQKIILEKMEGQPPKAPFRPRTRPTPDAIYAIDLDGSPQEGVEHAKVTIVKAFEFA